MATTYTADDLTRALAQAAQAFLTAMGPDWAGLPEAAPAPGPLSFDPLTEPPPLPFDPLGSKPEQKMTSLAYLGAIARINAEKGRGANADEVAHHAKMAGYPDGRAVSGWNSRAGSERVIENVGGARILNQRGHASIHELADSLQIEIEGDITPLPMPTPAASENSDSNREDFS
jgi:hypothetical protein